MKKISVDIDNCIANTFKAGMDVCMANASINVTGVEIGSDYKFRTDKMNHLLGVSPDVTNDMWPALFNSSYTIGVIDGASASLTKIRELGYEIVLTTARPVSVHLQTVAWLSENGIPYDHIVHAPGGHKYRYDTEDFGIYIEDNISEYDCIISSDRYKSGDKATLILFDYDWSKTLNVANNFTIINSWADITSIVEKLSINS